MTRSSGEVGSYEFTTVRPNLGVWRNDDGDGNLRDESISEQEKSRKVSERSERALVLFIGGVVGERR